MKKLQFLLYLGLACYLLPSCNKYLDNTPQNSIAGNAQWADTTTADLFLNSIYGDLSNNSSTPDPQDSYTDDNDGGVYWLSWQWKQGIVGADINGGTPMENDYNAADYTDWSAVYTFVRACNTYIQEVNANTATLPASYRNRRIDEARFLRAWFYTYLWMHVGGLPIITVPQEVTTDTHAQLYQSRTTFEQTFDFIDQQLDSIVNDNYLIAKYNHGDADAGRATIGAALALKGWIELFAASPAFNTATPVVGADPNHFYSFAGADNSRYATAAATNLKFINSLGNSVYSLYPDLTTLWTEGTEYNSEVIWDRQLLDNVGGDNGTDRDLFGGPVYILGQYYTWGNYDPTQELVDQFRMANGRVITDPNSGYDPQHPYVNREQRFYDWIVYDGAPYKQNWMPSTDTIYTRIDQVHPSLNQIDFATADVSNTAYYFRKTLNPDIRPAGGAIDGLNYIYYRYAEVLLNYAEAQNEAVGPDGSVYSALDQIRTRGSLPTLEATYGGQVLSQDSMRSVIRNERRVELCFENKRFYDIIRWRIAQSVMSVDRHAMKITNSSPTDDAGVWIYTPVLLGHPHVFTQQMYVNPIPQSVIDQNPNIMQNPNY
jgi:starch-binding outer membrane protein, SusD/RagB family